MEARRLLGLAAAALGSSGCVIAVPPSRLEVGAGKTLVQGRSPEAPTTTTASVRASVHPLQISRDLFERPVDFGAGYLYDYDGGEGDQGVVTQGGFFEASAPLVTHRAGDMLVTLDLRAQGRVLVTDHGERVGPGAALQLSGEVIGFADGGFSGSSGRGFVAGYSHGEGSMGLFLEGAYGRPDRDAVYTMTAGLMWRLPATVAMGIGF